MELDPAPKKFLSVEVRSGEDEIKLEQVPAVEIGTRRMRLSAWHGGGSQNGHVDLTEKEMVALLAQAIRAGVLSPNFIRSLRAEFEI